tara:strand:- start:5024 stop:5197 length:174 start_codon:yes stop_codon:yes gene_type:complete
MSEQTEKKNPLDLFTKDQVKSLLKGHSKKELLEKAVVWELIANEYKQKLDELNTDES